MENYNFFYLNFYKKLRKIYTEISYNLSIKNLLP